MLAHHKPPALLDSRSMDELTDKTQQTESTIDQAGQSTTMRDIGLTEVQTLLHLLKDDPKTRKHDLTDVVFIALDFEAYELDSKKITEAGVAVLDLKNAGDNAQDWHASMKYAHYITSEYAHLVNERHVKGCPDKFNFGDSQLVNLAILGLVLNRIFADPNKLAVAHDLDQPVIEQHRQIVLVGHALGNEFRYGKRIGFTPHSIIAKCDTQILAKLDRKMKRQIGLENLLTWLGIKFDHLHNGGNDAAYTLRALVEIATQALVSDSRIHKELDAIQAQQRAQTAENLKRREEKRAARAKELALEQAKRAEIKAAAKDACDSLALTLKTD